MASLPNRNFIRSSNSRGRGANTVAARQFNDIAAEEAVFHRALNFPTCTGTARIGTNNRNRRAASNTRNRLERIQTRRSDSGFPNSIREYFNPSIDNVDINERPQDNKENQTASPPKPKATHSLGNLININSARGIQESRPFHIFHQQPTPENCETANVGNSIAKKEGNTMSYSLPKAELSLSPTRIAPTTGNVHNLRFTINNPYGSTSLCKEVIPDASSPSTNSNSVPSTSSASESSGAVSSQQSKATVNDSWINAPEFHPKMCRNIPAITLTGMEFDKNICKELVENGDCKMLPYCPYTHDGDICDMCHKKVLHPTDDEQRKRHRQGCHRQITHVNISQQIAQSKDKTCGICFETVVEKDSPDRRFGILNRCNHVFCLTCIRKWRQARNFENRVVKSCPSCRVPSEFVCPSNYWVDTKDQKDKLIKCYKQVLSDKPCKYFKQGRGECPFGNKCFYLHALPDGTIADVGPPRRRPRPSREDRVIGLDLDQMILWDLHDFDPHWLYSLTEEFDDIAAFFSDSDDSDGIDFEIIFQRD